jgi:DNA-binding response OmpR family regulator
MRLLVVEDERELAELLRHGLEKAGFAVDSVHSMRHADEHLDVETYDALVLDLALPDGDGLDLLRRLRKRASALPVLILTARDGLDDRVNGLDSGADDYLVKPFHVPELVARIRAVLRVTLTAANLTLDTTGRRASVDGADIRLSGRELALLELLMRRQGEVVSREALESGLYSFADELGSNAMEVMLHRLRRKLADAAADVVVHTVRGIGYLLTPAT